MKILAILISFVFISCSNIQSAELTNYKTYYKNGNLHNFIHIKNNQKNGKIESYYEDGKIAVTGFFKNDKRDKSWYFYDEKTGKLIANENYKSGLLQGNQIYYYPNGQLKMKGKYNLNERTGFWELYRPNGSLEAQNIFLRGDNVVNVSIYQENGNIYCTGLIINGLRSGLWKYFDDNGKILYDIVYYQGIRHGKWRAYNEKGEFIIGGYFNQGHMLGL